MKLSEAINEVVETARAAAVEPESSVWLEYDTQGQCTACLGGALAYEATRECEAGTSFIPQDFHNPPFNNPKLGQLILAADFLRVGDIRGFIGYHPELQRFPKEHGNLLTKLEGSIRNRFYHNAETFEKHLSTLETVIAVLRTHNL